VVTVGRNYGQKEKRLRRVSVKSRFPLALLSFVSRRLLVSIRTMFEPDSWTNIYVQVTIGMSTQAFKGKVKLNVLPSPTLLSTQIRPPWDSIICLVIYKPNPVPGFCRVVEPSTW